VRVLEEVKRTSRCRASFALKEFERCSSDESYLTWAKQNTNIKKGDGKVKTTVLIFTLALGIACALSASAQTFKKVKVAKNAPVVQVASGGNSVWALASNGNPYIFNGKSFVLANAISLIQIAVGGGSAAQADAVWALNSSGNVYRASKNGSAWTFSQVPGALSLIEVGLGYQDSCHPYEVWGLNTSSAIFRYNFCRSTFDQIPGRLCELSVGAGDIWGAQCGPNVYRFNFFTGDFDQVADPFRAIPQLAVGPNGDVWATDTGSGTYYKYDVSAGFQLFGCCANQIEAGGNGVWFLGGTEIFHYDPSVPRFEEFFGASPVSLSVGSGGGVWGVDSSHQVFAFSTP
jgi:hypothetical protein